MKAVILAGGRGTRLGNVTLGVNKHLLPVGREPMIMQPLRMLDAFKTRQVLIVTGPESIGSFARLTPFVNFDHLESIYYGVQAEPGGIAQALAIAEDFCESGPVLAILGDNCFDKMDWKTIYDGCTLSETTGCAIWAKEVLTHDGREYGIVRLDPNGLPLEVVEKPPFGGQWAITGVYAFDARVWQYIKDLEPSRRGELEITDVIARFMYDRQLVVHKLIGEWLDLGRSLENYYDKATKL